MEKAKKRWFLTVFAVIGFVVTLYLVDIGSFSSSAVAEFNNGYGTLYEYKDTCEYVANEYQVVFYNAYEYLGIDGYTADEYLEDGIHLTDKGRQRYADALTKLILETEETKNN